MLTSAVSRVPFAMAIIAPEACLTKSLPSPTNPQHYAQQFNNVPHTPTIAGGVEMHQPLLSDADRDRIFQFDERQALYNDVLRGILEPIPEGQLWSTLTQVRWGLCPFAALSFANDQIAPLACS